MTYNEAISNLVTDELLPFFSELSLSEKRKREVINLFFGVLVDTMCAVQDHIESGQHERDSKVKLRVDVL